MLNSAYLSKQCTFIYYHKNLYELSTKTYSNREYFKKIKNRNVSQWSFYYIYYVQCIMTSSALINNVHITMLCYTII